MTLGKFLNFSESQFPHLENSLAGFMKGAAQENVYHSVYNFYNALSLHTFVAAGSLDALFYDSEVLCLS